MKYTVGEEVSIMLDGLLNSFDECGIDPRTTVVRCATQDEANILLDYLCAKGVWDEDQIQILKKYWKRYGDRTCYHLTNASWCFDSWYKNEYSNMSIVDFREIYKGTSEATVTDVSFSYDELFKPSST